MGKNIRTVTEEQEDLSNSLFAGYLKVCLEVGYIDPTGKSEAEIRAELTKTMKEVARSKKMLLSIDYADDLLALAEEFQKKRDPNYSYMFYAIWFEHWINHLIFTQGVRNRLSIKEIKLIIREIRIGMKYEIIPVLLGLPRINEAHVKIISKTSEIRNSFIHYKHVPIDADEMDQNNTALMNDIESIHKTVKYLKRYYRTNFNRFSDEKLKSIVKGKKA